MSLGSDYGQDRGRFVRSVRGRGETRRRGRRLRQATQPIVRTSSARLRSRPGVISVAQTQVPSAQAFPLIVNSPAAIAGTYPNTATVAWAPIGDGFTGDVAYVGQGCPADSIAPGSPEDPYLADPAGKVALIDRGACAVQLEGGSRREAGAIGVLIGLIAPGDAVSFSFGGGDNFVPTLVIQQTLSELDQGAPGGAGQRHSVSGQRDRPRRQHGQLVRARTVDQLLRHQAGNRRTGRIGLRRIGARATAKRPSAARPAPRRWCRVQRPC